MVAYALIAQFLSNYFSGPFGECPIWIPAGIGLGMVLTLGVRSWPFVLMGAMLGEMGGGLAFPLALQLACGSTLSFLAVNYILRRFTKFQDNFEKISDYGWLILASLLGSLISAGINTQFLAWSELIPQQNLIRVFQKWYLGDLFGLVLITPILLVMHQPWLKLWSKQKKVAFLFFILGTFLLGQAVFFGWLNEVFELSRRGFLFIFLIAFCSYQFGRQGALILFSMVIAQSLLGALQGKGFFGADLMANPGALPIWFYLCILGASGVIVSLLVKTFKSKNESLVRANWVAVQSAIHFKEIVASVPMLMVTYDLQKNLVDYINPYYTKILGYTLGDLVQSGGWLLLAYPEPKYRQEVEKEWNRRVDLAQHSNEPFESLETFTTAKDGSQRHIAWGCFQAEQRLVIYGQDLTEERKASKTLAMSSIVQQAMGEAIVINDASNRIVLANESFQKLTGFNDDDLIGAGFSDLLVRRHGARSYSDIFTSLEAVGRWEGQAWIKTKAGEDLLKFISIYSSFDADGLPLERIALISEVTSQRKARELISQHANFDPLTGLPNRRLMLDRLEQLVKRAIRSHKYLAVVYLDLDNFKNINDGRGHDFGDELLKAVSERLRGEVRETDTVARIGGDEFVILLSELDKPDSADLIMRGILKKLSEPFIIHDHSVHATASFGVSIYPNDGGDGKSLLLGADQAMYAAKSGGRNNYHYFTEDLQVQASARSNTITELRQALIKKQFFLVYQPIVDLQTGAIIHAEALIRMRRDNGEIVLPNDFIAIAEESGLIVEIGDWALQELLSFIQSLEPSNQIAFALNVSAAQFASNQHSSDTWLSSILDSGINPSRLILEITERMMLVDSHRVRGKITMLQELGCQFSVDDFGTGYSSLASLKDFNFDYIKIDAHFISMLAADAKQASLVAAMVSMAKALGLSSVAEGVETEAQANMLRAMGCDFAQGYFFSKPLSADAVKGLSL